MNYNYLTWLDKFMDYRTTVKELVEKLAILNKETDCSLLNISKGEAGILMALSYHPEGLTPNEIIKLTGFSSPHCAKTLRSLTVKGETIRQVSVEDKRSASFLLTEKGTQHIESLKEQLFERLVVVLDALGEKDCGEIMRILDKLIVIERSVSGDDRTEEY